MYQPFRSSPSLVVNSTFSYGGSEVGARYLCSRRVGDDVGERDREQDDHHDDGSRGREQRPPRVPPEPAVVPASRSPQRRGADAEEQQPGCDGQVARVVVAGRAAIGRVVGGLGAREHTENAEHEREDGAEAGTRAPVAGRGTDDQRQRDEPAEQVAGRRGA